jgi:hypothetical protein
MYFDITKTYVLVISLFIWSIILRNCTRQIMPNAYLELHQSNVNENMNSSNTRNNYTQSQMNSLLMLTFNLLPHNVIW